MCFRSFVWLIFRNLRVKFLECALNLVELLQETLVLCLNCSNIILLRSTDEFLYILHGVRWTLWFLIQSNKDYKTDMPEKCKRLGTTSKLVPFASRQTTTIFNFETINELRTSRQSVNYARFLQILPEFLFFGIWGLLNKRHITQTGVSDQMLRGHKTSIICTTNKAWPAQTW